jgi:hypothetical protein
VEPASGVILRQQTFGGEGWQTLEQEIEVIDLALDVDLPQELFDPRQEWSGGFAQDESGEPGPPGNWVPQITWWPAPGHELLPYTPSPPGFDPASSRLTLQIPQRPGQQWPYRNPRPRSFDLLAGPYTLGRLEFGNPFGLRCDRSPDGQWLAFMPGGHWLEFSQSWPEAELRWINLSEVENLHRPAQPFETNPTSDFAFSPDSHQLAITGYDPISQSDGLFLVDVATGERNALLNLHSAFSLAWSPDGDFLAMLAWDWDNDVDHLEARVVNVTSGEIIYRTSVEHDTFLQVPEERSPDWPAPGWPGHAWGIEFPIMDRGLEQCVQPPER